MGSPYLNANESIILATHRIIVKSVSSDVILTNQRLIFVDSQNSRFLPQTIPLAKIETVLARDSETGDPVITISIAAETRNDPTQSLDLSFSRWEAEERETERDAWVMNLKSAIASVRENAKKPELKSVEPAGNIQEPSGQSSGDMQSSGTASVASEETTESGSVSLSNVSPGKIAASLPSHFPENESGTVPNIPMSVSAESRAALSDRFHPSSSGSSKKFPAIAVMGIICIIAGLVLGVFFFTDIGREKYGIPAIPLETPVTSPIPTVTPVPLQTATPEQIPTFDQMQTPAPVTSEQPVFIVPQTGVWVRINYSGNYTGSYGTSGRMHPVTSSGEHIYQIPAENDTIEAMFQKLDGSGNALTVETFKNGVVVGKEVTSAPAGTIDLHVDLSKF